MDAKLPLPLKLPPDVWRWIRAEAAQRRMPVENFALELLRRGIVDHTVEQTVHQITSVLSATSCTREQMRQLLVVRFLLEASLTIAAHEGVMQDAVESAEVELTRIWPES